MLLRACQGFWDDSPTWESHDSQSISWVPPNSVGMIARVTLSRKQDGLWFRDDIRMIVRACLWFMDDDWMIVRACLGFTTSVLGLRLEKPTFTTSVLGLRFRV